MMHASGPKMQGFVLEKLLAWLAKFNMLEVVHHTNVARFKIKRMMSTTIGA